MRIEYRHLATTWTEHNADGPWIIRLYVLVCRFNVAMAAITSELRSLCDMFSHEGVCTGTTKFIFSLTWPVELSSRYHWSTCIESHSIASLYNPDRLLQTTGLAGHHMTKHNHDTDISHRSPRYIGYIGPEICPSDTRRTFSPPLCPYMSNTRAAFESGGWNQILTGRIKFMSQLMSLLNKSASSCENNVPLNSLVLTLNQRSVWMLPDQAQSRQLIWPTPLVYMTYRSGPSNIELHPWHQHWPSFCHAAMFMMIDEYRIHILIALIGSIV